MSNFAEGDNAFSGLFGDVPNKEQKKSRVENHRSRTSLMSQKTDPKVNNGEPATSS